MKLLRYILSALAIVLICQPQAQAQYKFKFDEPVELIDRYENPRDPQIIWTGSLYAVAYHTFYYNSGTSEVYLIFVNKKAELVGEPIQVSSDSYAMHPKLVWSGSKIGIYYAGGTRNGKVYDLNHYFALYSAEGKELANVKLPGSLHSYQNADKSDLIWTGKNYGVFYGSIPPGETVKTNGIFCRISAGGELDDDYLTYENGQIPTAVAWDGKSYIAVAGHSLDSLAPKGDVHLINLNKDGKITKYMADARFTNVDYDKGASIAPTGKSRKYLLAISGVSNGDTNPATDTNRYDVFTSTVKMKKKSTKFNLAVATEEFTDSWINPVILRSEEKFYLVANCDAGCSFAFVKLSSTGHILSNPLIQFHPG